MPTESWHLRINVEPKMPRDFWMSSCCNKKTLDHSENLPRRGNMSQYIPSEAQIWSIQGKGWTHPSWLKDWKPAVDPIDLDNPYWKARWEPLFCKGEKKGGAWRKSDQQGQGKHMGKVWRPNIRRVARTGSLHCWDTAVTGNGDHGF